MALRNILTFALCLALVGLLPSVQGYGEDITTPGVPGFIPTWQGRAFMALLNLVRIAPQQYRDDFALDYHPSVPTIFNGTLPQTAVRIEYGLLQAGSYHAYDIANHCPEFLLDGRGANDCNGTTLKQRTNAYYPCPGANSSELTTAAPNSFRDPRITMATLLCQRKTGEGCALDDAPGLNRFVFLLPDYTAAAAAQYPTNATTNPQYFWVVDVGNLMCTEASNTIYMGSHFFNFTTIFFVAIYRSNGAPQEAQIIIDDFTYPLSRLYGNDTQAAYYINQTTANACRQYYFRFVDDQGILRRFPDTGVLVTFNEGECNQSFIAGPGFPTATTATTAATTTIGTTATTGTTGQAATTSTGKLTTSAPLSSTTKGTGSPSSNFSTSLTPITLMVIVISIINLFVGMF